jgi:hypothetical protein
MVVTNIQRETAIVIRRDGETAAFVRFHAGKLACERLTEAQFREQWHETNYALSDALQRFLEHAESHGTTQEALKGLLKLQARDSVVVANLF